MATLNFRFVDSNGETGRLHFPWVDGLAVTQHGVLLAYRTWCEANDTSTEDVKIEVEIKHLPTGGAFASLSIRAVEGGDYFMTGYLVEVVRKL